MRLSDAVWHAMHNGGNGVLAAHERVERDAQARVSEVTVTTPPYLGVYPVHALPPVHSAVLPMNLAVVREAAIECPEGDIP